MEPLPQKKHTSVSPVTDLSEEINNSVVIKEIIQPSKISPKPLEAKKKRGLFETDNEVIKEKLPLPDDKIIIRFQYNTNNFIKEDFKILKSFSDIIMQHPDTKIMITGYTDSDGLQKYNIKLSVFRANIVKSFLLGRGLSSNQIEIRGLGSINPIKSNNTAKGRKMNRRVEIEIIK